MTICYHGWACGCSMHTPYLWCAVCCAKTIGKPPSVVLFAFEKTRHGSTPPPTPSPPPMVNNSWEITKKKLRRRRRRTNASHPTTTSRKGTKQGKQQQQLALVTAFQLEAHTRPLYFFVYSLGSSFLIGFFVQRHSARPLCCHV